LRRRFEAVGAFGKQAFTCCGGGIAASADAFALILLGHLDVKLYDASHGEWAIDTTLPIETSQHTADLGRPGQQRRPGPARTVSR
jgi:thiosulfate/3-mercaptopyruvate sulfurtransferase